NFDKILCYTSGIGTVFPPYAYACGRRDCTTDGIPECINLHDSQIGQIPLNR
ncbi:hypothetical protein V3C99_010265, partial [Haemonchus contortus]